MSCTTPSSKDPDSCKDQHSCRICLQSRSEINRRFACYLGDLIISSRRVNALVRLKCDCSVGSMRYICYCCLQRYESHRGCQQCDLCHRRLFPRGAGPRRLLQAVFWLKCCALAALAALLVLVSVALCNPAQRAVSAVLASGFVAASALLVALSLAALLALQFRRGELCPLDGRRDTALAATSSSSSSSSSSASSGPEPPDDVMSADDVIGGADQPILRGQQSSARLDI